MEDREKLEAEKSKESSSHGDSSQVLEKDVDAESVPPGTSSSQGSAGMVYRQISGFL